MVNQLPGQAKDEVYQVSLGGATDVPSAEVLLVTDADHQFGNVEATYAALRQAGEIRPLLLVGVGYGGSFRSPLNRRMRDYTPAQLADEPGTGGAEAFLTWINQQLRPWLRERGLGGGPWGVTGHSLGALWGLYAFFHDEGGFGACLASAPSVWFGDRVLLRRLAGIREARGSWPGRLVLSIGTEDSPSMLGDLALLESQLAERPFAGLEIISQRFPGYNHYDVGTVAMEAGLRALYPAAESGIR